MVEYYYDSGIEAFKRADKRGKPLYINVTEAQRIVSLLDLGYSVSEIEGKISLANPKGTITTIKSFIKNYRSGNISMPVDAPAPVKVFESMTDSNRIEALEERVAKLEEQLMNKKENRVISWLRS